jgi:hypothetical protein
VETDPRLWYVNLMQYQGIKPGILFRPKTIIFKILNSLGFRIEGLRYKPSARLMV